MDDKERKGRGNHPTGERNHPKLNWVKVREIRRLKSTTSVTNVSLGIQFGVSANTIKEIVHNRKWKEPLAPEPKPESKESNINPQYVQHTGLAAQDWVTYPGGTEQDGISVTQPGSR